jgi:hypothetical protein
LDPDVALVVALVVGGMLAGVGGWRWMRRRERRLEHKATLDEVCRQFSGEEVMVCSPYASFEGFDRMWDNPWRGEGVLLCTRDMLYFRPSRARVDLSIPMARIEKVEMGRKRENSRSDRSLLQVSYKGADDQLRVATWLVDRPEEWIKLIHNVQTRMAPHER